MPKKECDYSPDGKHEGETAEIIIKGKPVIRLVCKWCGKNMGKLCLGGSGSCAYGTYSTQS